MNGLQKSCLIGGLALVLGGTSASVGFAQLHEQSTLLRMLWPFGRQQNPVPLAPQGAAESKAEPEGDRPLVAPFVPRKIDINTCTLAQLQSLPGVTASQAARIFAGRPYRNYADLERDGIPLTVVQGLRGNISFGRRPD